MKFIVIVCSLFGSLSAFSAGLTFDDFVGNYELVRCTQRVNSVKVSPTGLCDTSYYIEMAISGQDNRFQLMFTDSHGNDVTLPTLYEYTKEGDDYVENAKFTSTPDGAIWLKNKRKKQGYEDISKTSFTLFYGVSDGVPTMHYTTYEGRSVPPKETRRQFKLK